MLWTLLPAFAAPTVEIDFDGDGKAETARFDSNTMRVHVGKASFDAESESCEFEVHDISSTTPGKELGVCCAGIRDSRDCTLYTQTAGTLVAYETKPPAYSPQITTTGNGIVLITDGYRSRLFTSVQKFTVKDGALVETPQPILTAPNPVPMKIDRTFPILFDPTSKQVVANVRPGSVISVLGEHGSEEGWLLLRLSSGVTGWANWQTLAEASTDYGRIMGAG